MKWGTATAASTVGAITLASLALLVLVPGQPLVAALPPIAALLLLAVFRLPLRTCVLILFALVLVSHSPQDKPAAGLWVSPLQHLGALLTQNLNSALGMRFLPFSVVDAITALLLLLAFDRRALTRTMPRPLLGATLLFGAALVVFAVHGKSNGGSLDAAYWQIRELVYIPLFTLLFAAALRGTDDVKVISQIVIVTALIKAAVGIFFVFAIARPRGLHPDYATTHSDSMHFVLAIAALAVTWLEAPTRARAVHGMLFSVPLLAILVVNDRRLAWVGLMGVAAIALCYARRSHAKRAVLRLGFALLPILALYGAVGWNIKAGPFKPVQTIRSMIATKEDSSSRWRDFENYNLAATVSRVRWVGQGLGLPYDEAVRAPSIARDFALFKHIPHNSVLWLLTVGGLFGFIALMWLFWANAYFAARTLRLSEHPAFRIGAVLSLCATFLFLVQCYGDMGTQSWTTVLLFAAAVAQTAIVSQRALAGDEAAAPARSAQILTMEFSR